MGFAEFFGRQTSGRDRYKTVHRTIKLDALKEKIVIVGPGALGCLFAGLLSQGGHELWLLDKHPERARHLSLEGLTILDGPQKKNCMIKASADAEEPGIARLVVVCVKAYDTEAAAERARPLVGDQTDVLSLQNGLGNVEALVRVFGVERVLGGTTAQGANLVAPGQVRHAGRGETVIGEPEGGTTRAEAVAEIFNSIGIQTRVTTDLEGLIWSKLVINAAINPLTAILKVRNGALPSLESARAIMAGTVEEAVAICRRKGIQLLFDDPLARAVQVAEATAENISSMLQDVRAKRRTEIDYINGAAAREAEALGMAAPVNLALARVVTAIEQSYDLKV